MYRDEMRQTVTARFYQSLAESGVEIDAIPQTQLQALVNALTDGLLEALEGLELEETEPFQSVPTTVAPTEEETLLWRGKPYLSIGVRYELTSQRLRILRGLLGRRVEEVELIRIRDTSVTQNLGERTLNVGDVKVYSNDPSAPEFTLHNVKDAMDVRELIRKAVLAERERQGFHYREEM